MDRFGRVVGVVTWKFAYLFVRWYLKTDLRLVLNRMQIRLLLVPCPSAVRAARLYACRVSSSFVHHQMHACCRGPKVLLSSKFYRIMLNKSQKISPFSGSRCLYSGLP